MLFSYRYIVFCFFVFALFSCKHQQKSVKTNETSSSTKSIQKKYAEKLNVKPNDILNEQLYIFIDEWYGVPYKYAGKDKNGIDCSGLTFNLYKSVYKKIISSNTKSLVEETKKIKQDELTEGDLVFFITNGKSISHVGVYLKNNKFVHASTKKGVMISDLNEPYFKQTFARAARVK